MKFRVLGSQGTLLLKFSYISQGSVSERKLLGAGRE
jgi:hypothetical protein